MSDWFSYELVQLVPFGKDVYFRLIARLNDAAFPQQCATLGVGIMAMINAHQRNPLGAVLYLAPLWATTALIFFFGGYSELHWAGNYAGGVFLVQAPLLIWHGWTASAASETQGKTGAINNLGYALLATGFVLWPAAGALYGAQGNMAEILGIHADPTAIFSVGVSLLIFRGRRLLFAVAPCVLWLVVSGLTHMALSTPFGWPLLTVALLGTCLPMARRRALITRH